MQKTKNRLTPTKTFRKRKHKNIQKTKNRLDKPTKTLRKRKNQKNPKNQKRASNTHKKIQKTKNGLGTPTKKDKKSFKKMHIQKKR